MLKTVVLCACLVFAFANPVQNEPDVILADPAERFNPDRQIVLHLYTRENPTESQPILNGNEGLLELISYDSKKRTVILLPGNHDDEESSFANTLISAFLTAEDVNVILVDWSRGASNLYWTAVNNAIATGESVAKFINWLNSITGATPNLYHIVGHGHGGHMAGVVGRNVEGEVAYVTGLDPNQLGWITNDQKLRPSDASYTEAIHTSAGIVGYLGTLADADFYPNGGVIMSGCGTITCDHERSFHYFAESIVTGGFNARRCLSYITAMTQSCTNLLGSLRMGGLVPKIGSSGIYHLQTNSNPSYSL